MLSEDFFPLCSLWWEWFSEWRRPDGQMVGEWLTWSLFLFSSVVSLLFDQKLDHPHHHHPHPHHCQSHHCLRCFECCHDTVFRFHPQGPSGKAVGGQIIPWSNHRPTTRPLFRFSPAMYNIAEVHICISSPTNMYHLISDLLSVGQVVSSRRGKKQMDLMLETIVSTVSFQMSV